jgi:hypothetical protein
MPRFRLIDTAGSVIEIVEDSRTTIEEGSTVLLPSGEPIEVLEVYDDEYGREGGVVATLVVDQE